MVFLRKGFHKATMDDIARETGLSKGALYLYFPSKENLLIFVTARLIGPDGNPIHKEVTRGGLR